MAAGWRIAICDGFQQAYRTDETISASGWFYQTHALELNKAPAKRIDVKKQ